MAAIAIQMAVIAIPKGAISLALLPEEIAVIGHDFQAIALRFRVPAKVLGATGISIAVSAKVLGIPAQPIAVPVTALGGSAKELWQSATGFRAPP